MKQAVVLAAGRGSRLGALTQSRPKPMLPLQGKPVLEHSLLQMNKAGLTDFVLVVGYHAEVIQAYFGDGSAWGLRLQYALQPVANGTGAALALAREYVGTEPFIASYGDILTASQNYEALIQDYTGAPCAAVVGINRLPDPSAGAAVYLEGRRVVGVLEKPPPGTAHSHWNLAGVSVYGPAIWAALETLQLSSRGEYELTSAIQTLIDGGHEVRACEIKGYWSDIGTPEALQEAERNFVPG